MVVMFQKIYLLSINIVTLLALQKLKPHFPQYKV